MALVSRTWVLSTSVVATSADGEGDGRRDGDRRAAVRREAARVEVVETRVVARRVRGEDDALTGGHGERSPQVGEELAAGHRGVHVDIDPVDRDRRGAGVVESNRARVVAGGQRPAGILPRHGTAEEDSVRRSRPWCRELGRVGVVGLLVLGVADGDGQGAES